ncbi:DUF3052 family protein [Streptomyces sp. NPDC002057]|uniref:DUF3052 family protein n=1 Tax=Streptomyces sp. NPDC002057 TaxID=3154664 RepID=UPI0033199864
MVDKLTDAVGLPAEDGVTWVLNSESDHARYVRQFDVAEAAPTVGLAQTSSVSVGHDWTGTRLVSPKTAKAKR